MEFTVYGPLRASTGEKTVEIPVDGDTVGDAIEAFVEVHPRTRGLLLKENGKELQPSVRVMVDGERIEFDEEYPPNATLQLMPAAQGGCEIETTDPFK